MADIINTGASAAASLARSEASTAQVDSILLRSLARALLSAGVDIRAARRDGRLAVDRTGPAYRRPAGRAGQFDRSPGRHSGRQRAVSPDVTGAGGGKSQPRPAGESPVVDSDSLGSSS